MGLQRNALNLMHGSFNLENDRQGKTNHVLGRQLSNVLGGNKMAKSQNRWR